MVAKPFLALLAALSLAFAGILVRPALPAAPVAQATIQCAIEETQAWWDKDGIVVPTAVGAHVHVEACIPLDSVIVDGPYDMVATVKYHNQPGHLNFVRVQEATSAGAVERARAYATLGPCTDCSVQVTLHIDFSKWTTGRDEMRLSAITNNPDGTQQYQSSGFQIPVRSFTPTYRTGIYNEARGWYTGHGYAQPRLTSAMSAIKSGGTINIKLGPGSGGLPTTYAGVFIDPDFHHGSAGIIVRTWTAAFTGSVTLPALVAGSHKLVLLASDGQNAGVLAIPFVTP